MDGRQCMLSEAAWMRRAMASTAYWAPQNVLFMLLSAYIDWYSQALTYSQTMFPPPELTTSWAGRGQCARRGDARLKESASDVLYKRKMKHQENLISFVA